MTIPPQIKALKDFCEAALDNNESKAVACIGSREISVRKRDFLWEIGKFIVGCAQKVCSGNAQGSDQAYAAGGNNVEPHDVILCLPWWSYEKQAIVQGNQIFVEDRATLEEVHLAREHHPKWSSLSQGVQKLMIRNAMIIIRSKLVVANLNPTKPWGGGTGHGVRIAKSLKIPVLDITHLPGEENFKEWF